MKKIFSLLLLTAFIGIMLTGCKKNKGDPPALPPEESMEIDFSNFTPAGTKAADVLSLKGVEDYNWSFAVTSTLVFRSASVLLAIPVAAFKLAIDQTPVFIEDATWQWSYTYLSTYNVRLTGQIRSSDVLWNMYIAKTGTGAFGEFLWYTGTSKLDGTGGDWVLNLSPADPNPVLEIDWTRSSDVVNSVKYTYVKSGAAENGSYITLSRITGTYDARFVVHFYNGSGWSDAEVEWNIAGKNGQVKCLAYFGDSEWHLWDTSHLDP